MTSTTTWLLSAYGAASHRHWAGWLETAFPEAGWRRLELPGRHFAWRIRGNPLSWLDELPDGVPECIVATSMVDVATLKGLHPRLASVPVLLYFHENQFAYPLGERQAEQVEAQMVQLYAALAADRIAFNSGYNRRTFLAGVASLLDRLPDHVPRGVPERIDAKSTVLPVPIEPAAPSCDRDPRLVLWNHRWEHDKRPDRFADALIALHERGVEFRLALLGPRHRNGHADLDRIRAAMPGRIVVDECPTREAYRQWLGRAAIAVGTADHEFQGLALLEAASAGCAVLVPDALCYPEQYPDPCRYPAGDVDALVDRLERWLDGEALPAVDVSPWTSDAMLSEWERALRDLR